MKKYLFFAAALIGLASCTNEDYAGDQSLLENKEQAISFGYDLKTATRADKTGSDAATALNNQFIVYGEKSEADGNAPAAGNLVFQNYQVNYGANTAYTSTSNTKDWEYVGYQHTSAYQSHITTSTTDMQTIKYWDYSASNYVFTAVSALPADITAGDVSITKNTSGSTVYDKGYTITTTASAHLSNLYIADRQEIASSSAGTDRNAVNHYGGNVTLKFRNLLSHVRVGMYETIPGYSVTIKKFYYLDGATPTFATMTTEGTDKFYANVPNVNASSGVATTFTVTYQSSGTVENQPIVTNSATPANYIALGTNLKENTLLSTTIATPTYDQDGVNYTTVLPQETNDKTLKLKVDYTLKAPVTNEVIEVTGATAEIPAVYLQWKPNYKYTYIFKISDNTNGTTGQGVVGLYPITFDGMVVEAEDGKAEYITTVSEPSITTIGVNGSAYITGSQDYPAGTDVYATVEDASSLATLSAENMKLYTVTAVDANNFPITSASVAEALIEGPTLTKAEADLAKIVLADGSLTYQKTVPGEDGVDKTLDASNNKAAKFTTVASKVYALVYQKTGATYTTDGGKTYADATAFENAGTLYTDAACTTKAASYTNASTTYYKRTGVTDKGVYAIKIVKVAP